MLHLKTKRRYTTVKIGVVAASLFFAMLPAPVQADISSGMDAMWTATTPEFGAVNGNYGGSLGGMSMRAPVRSFNVLAYDPPRFSAGCGGIDAYFGSFSMMSVDNMRNIIRAIMANGTGYALKIALDNMCPACQNIMSGLHDMTSKINGAAKNTCQISSAMVEAVRGDTSQMSSMVGETKSSFEGAWAAAKGAMSDFSEAMQKRSYAGKNANRPDDAADQSTVYGNNMMNTLSSAGVFGKGGQDGGGIDTEPYGGDQSYLQLAMNLYGTTVAMTGSNASSSTSGGSFVKESKETADKVYEGIWNFRDLAYGKETGSVLQGYKCSEFNINKADSCQTVTLSETEFPGVKRYIINMMAGKQTAFGDSNSMGDSVVTTIAADSVMAHLADNSIAQNSRQLAFINAIPDEIRTKLAAAAKGGSRLQTSAVSAFADAWAEQMAAELVTAMNKNITSAYSVNVSASGKNIAPLSDAQKAKMAQLEQEAAARLNFNARAQTMQNLSTMLDTALAVKNGLNTASK